MADLPTIKGMPRRAQLAVAAVIGLLILLLFLDKLLMPALVHSQSVVTIPNFIGRSAKDVVRELGEKRFPIEKIDTHYDERYAAGTVIYQNPYAGAEVKEGRKVFLTISSGRELLSIPNVTGLPVREAKIRLQMAGLSVGDVNYEPSATVPDDVVIRQSSAPGSRLGIGASMTLTVSNGPEQQMVAVPALVGRTLSEAQALVQSSKLVFGQIAYKANRAVVPSTVLDQTPAAGDSVLEGSAIRLTISGD